MNAARRFQIVPQGICQVMDGGCGNKVWNIAAARDRNASRRAQGVGVFEVSRCGVGVVMNWVASRTPRPNGVGIETRNGTTTRVPMTGASQTSTSRWVTRYFTAGRDG